MIIMLKKHVSNFKKLIFNNFFIMESVVKVSQRTYGKRVIMCYPTLLHTKCEIEILMQNK